MIYRGHFLCSIAQYYISLYLGWEVYIDDQYRNPNMNNKDYLFGRLTTFYVSLDAFMLILISMSSTKPGESVDWSVCNTFRWGCKLALYQHPQVEGGDKVPISKFGLDTSCVVFIKPIKHI